MGMGKREGSHEGPTGQEREWWGLYMGSDRARQVVYRARLGRSPWGSDRARKSSLVGQEGVHGVPQGKEVIPYRAARCPGRSTVQGEVPLLSREVPMDVPQGSGSSLQGQGRVPPP